MALDPVAAEVVDLDDRIGNAVRGAKLVDGLALALEQSSSRRRSACRPVKSLW